ncbi:MAG: flagellar hook-associated protein FlgL [Betaproteobacteria bacterium]
MRITNQMMVSRFLRNLNANLALLSDSNEKLSTGKRIQRPSDDPIAVARSLQLRTSLNETEQFIRNVASATSWMEAADSAMSDVSAVLQRAKEIAVSGANGTLVDGSLAALADEVDKLLEHAVQVANSDHAGRYIFGGFQTIARPFNAVTGPAPGGWIQPPGGQMITAVNYAGDSGNITYEVGSGILATVNAPGDAVFNQVFQALIDLRDNLRSRNQAAITSSSLDLIDQAVDNLLEWQAELGARTNQLELTNNRLLELKANFQKLLSENEDADIAEVIMQLKMQENVYRAALDAGARIIQPTLLDFLR